jgi:hypothetical protein
MPPRPTLCKETRGVQNTPGGDSAGERSYTLAP